jgi:ribonuclease HI
MIRGVAFCDGRGNAGTGACSAILKVGENEYEHAVKLGEVTNNIAEYKGVILAIEMALHHEVTHLQIYSDSQLIVYQLQGKYKMKNEALRPLRDEAREKALQFDEVEINWIPREQNSRADALCRRIDKYPSARPKPELNNPRPAKLTRKESISRPAFSTKRQSRGRRGKGRGRMG